MDPEQADQNIESSLIHDHIRQQDTTDDQIEKQLRMDIDQELKNSDINLNSQISQDQDVIMIDDNNQNDYHQAPESSKVQEESAVNKDSSLPYEKSNDESMVSENEVKDLITPGKESGNTLENSSPQGKPDSINSNKTSSIIQSEILQNQASYSQIRPIQTQPLNNDGYSSRIQAMPFQGSGYQSIPQSNFRGGYNLRGSNSYHGAMTRGINTGIGIQKQQSFKAAGPVPQTAPPDSKLAHYSKIIDDLKEENKKYREQMETSLRRKDTFMEYLVNEHKQIIKEKNQIIQDQNKLIDTLTKSFSCPPPSQASSMASFEKPSISQGFKKPDVPQRSEVVAANSLARPFQKPIQKNTVERSINIAPVVKSQVISNLPQTSEKIPSSEAVAEAKPKPAPVNVPTSFEFKLGGGAKLGIKNAASKQRFLNFMADFDNDFDEPVPQPDEAKVNETNPVAESVNPVQVETEIEKPVEEEQVQKEKPNEATSKPVNMIKQMIKRTPGSTFNIPVQKASPMVKESVKTPVKNEEVALEPVESIPSSIALMEGATELTPSLIKEYLSNEPTSISLAKMIQEHKNRESPLGRYNLITKRITSQLYPPPTSISCICTRPSVNQTESTICLICENNTEISLSQFHRLLVPWIPSPSSQFCPEWSMFHARYSLWKLHAFQRACKDHLKILTVENVVHDLVKKYDKEFSRGKRSFFQRVVDGDESMQGRNIVILIADIIQQHNRYILELYDGTYSMFAVVDQSESDDGAQISKLIEDNKIFIGIKLHVAGGYAVKEGIDDIIKQKQIH